MKRIREHLSYANVAATLALLFAMSGGAIAATGGFSSGGALRACANEEGAIMLLKPGKHCRKGQTAVAWNQTGPAGAPGAKGAAGAAGAAGPAGLAGASIQGPRGTAGDENVKWATVGAAGNIENGRGITKVDGAKSPYEVTFDRDVSSCAIVAAADQALIGRLSTGLVLNTDRNASDRVQENVYIENSEGTNVPARFSIVAYC